jgi:hypothetical protein
MTEADTLTMPPLALAQLAIGIDRARREAVPGSARRRRRERIDANRMRREMPASVRRVIDQAAARERAYAQQRAELEAFEALHNGGA